MFPKDATSPPSQAAAVAVEVAGGPAAVVSVGVTPTLDARGLFLRPTLTRSLLSRNKHYPDEVYAKFTPAEKAKHWQLRNPGKERGTGPTGGRKSGVSVTNVSNFATAISSAVSAISVLIDMTKRANKEGTNDDPPTDQSNRDNPALAHQTKKTKPN